MKRYSFGTLFLIVAVVLFIALEKNVVSSIILMLASLYLICEVIPQIWRLIKDAKR